MDPLPSSAPYQPIPEGARLPMLPPGWPLGDLPGVWPCLCALGVGAMTLPVPPVEPSVLTSRGQASLSHQSCLLEFSSDSKNHLMNPFITGHSQKPDRPQNGNRKTSPCFLPHLLLRSAPHSSRLLQM